MKRRVPQITQRLLFAAKNKLAPQHRLAPVCRLFSSAAPWEDRFPREDLLNVWGTDISPLDNLSLDKSSRYVMQLLHGLHLNLQGWELDRATKERCNRVIEQLSSSDVEGRATRADEILRGMQIFYGKGDDRMVLPHPNADTYLMVLRLFATDPAASPQRAQEIVESMQQRYEEAGQLDLQPNVVHWNQVLSCWANSKGEDKAFHAANLLQRLKRKDSADRSSYSHVLRACARSEKTSKSRKLGAEVAIKVYKEARSRTDLEPTSYLYSFYLQALANLTDQERRDAEALSAFRDCCKTGYMNAYVLDNFRQTASSKLYQKTFGDRVLNTQKASVLLKRMAKSDTRNA